MLQPTELPAEAPPSSKRAKWRKLESISDVRLALATVIKRVYDERMHHERGAVCINGLRALAKTLHDSQIEERIAELESRVRAAAQ